MLASGSPRRRELLEEVGVRFEVEPSDIDESIRPGEDGPRYVERLAVEKALVAARPDAVVLAADTTVDLDGDLLGKPADRAEAVDLMARLSGSTHQVHTGVAVVWFARGGAPEPSVLAGVATTDVTLAELPPSGSSGGSRAPSPTTRRAATRCRAPGGCS